MRKAPRGECVLRAWACVIVSAAAATSVVACGSASTEFPAGNDAGASSSSSSGAGSSGGSTGDSTDASEADSVTSPAPDASTAVAPHDAGAPDATATVRDASTAQDASRASEGGDAGVVVVGGDAGVVAYKGVANSACNDLVTLGASWYYNWTLSPGSCTASRFVPMVWGHTGSEQTAAGIASEVKGLVSAGYDTVLGFNEPDNTGQSNMTVAAAIALWPSLTQSALHVGSPATQGNATGIAWIQSFMSQVNADTTGTLRVDFIAFHWYGWNAGSCDATGANLESYLKQIEAIPGNRPIWLTEWGCLNLSNPTAAVVQAFYSGAIAMLAKHPRVVRYGWYPWTTNNELVTSTDTLTPLGTAFAAAPASK